MQAATKIAVLFFLGVGFANGQEEALIGLPVDLDFFGPDFRSEESYKDEDIFKDDTYLEKSNTYLEDTLISLCNQYDLVINNQPVDCNNLRLVQKGLNINEHSLHKREAGDEPQLDEGSGAGEEAPINEEPVGEAVAEEPPADGKEKESPQESELPTEEQTTATKLESEPSINETAPVESNADLPKEESPAESDAATETKTEQQDGNDNEVPAVTAADDTTQTTTSDSEAEQNTETASEAQTTESATSQGLNPAVVGGIKKKGRVLKPSDLAETDKTKGSENDEAGKGDTETVKEDQSGIAVLHSADKGTLESTDEAVNNMKPKENLKQAPTDGQEQAGESTKDIQQGRKDTKVLVILFVAVVVVGGAAFAYNFIKKRKQKKAAAATENGANNTARNLQNVTTPAKSDPEHGTELKPLMKTTEQKPVVEYTDEKENRKAEEVK